MLIFKSILILGRVAAHQEFAHLDADQLHLYGGGDGENFWGANYRRRSRF